MRKVFKIVGFLILAIIGGGIFQLFLVPYLISQPYFQNFGFIKNLKREVIINPVEQFIIREGEGFVKVIDRVRASVLTVSPDKKVEGCGFVLTSDGLIITSSSLIPENQNFIFINNEKTEFIISDQDKKDNLALIKIESENLKTVSFADSEKIKPGEELFLIARKSSELEPPKIVVNEGVIKSLSEDLIETNILEKESVESCPLFNLEGQFMGLAKVEDFRHPDLPGQVFFIPAPVIREFAGL